VKHAHRVGDSFWFQAIVFLVFNLFSVFVKDTQELFVRRRRSNLSQTFCITGECHTYIMKVKSKSEKKSFARRKLPGFVLCKYAIRNTPIKRPYGAQSDQ